MLLIPARPTLQTVQVPLLPPSQMQQPRKATLLNLRLTLLNLRLTLLNLRLTLQTQRLTQLTAHLLPHQVRRVRLTAHPRLLNLRLTLLNLRLTLLPQKLRHKIGPKRTKTLRSSLDSTAPSITPRRQKSMLQPSTFQTHRTMALDTFVRRLMRLASST